LIKHRLVVAIAIAAILGIAQQFAVRRETLAAAERAEAIARDARQAATNAEAAALKANEAAVTASLAATNAKQASDATARSLDMLASIGKGVEQAAHEVLRTSEPLE
jgi:hypothetical protein